MATVNSIGSSKPVEVAFGGIGASTLTDHGVLIGSGTGAITPLTVGTNGQLLIGSSAADPVFAALTSTGSTITFTTGAGTLNLESSASPTLTMNDQTGTTYTLVLTDNGKMVTLTNGAAIALTIPTHASVAFPIGANILLYAGGAGTVTTGAAGATLRSRGSVYDSAGQYAMMSIVQIAEDVWCLSGDIA